MTDSEEIRGLKVWTNPKNRFTIVRIHYTADPMKDPERLVCDNDQCREWTSDKKLLGEECPVCKEGKYHNYGEIGYEEVPGSQKQSDRQQEYEIDFTVKSGKRVYSSFNINHHTGIHKAPRRSLLYRGWDFGRHHPCAVVCYDNTTLDRLEALYCFLGYNITFLVFCKQVVIWSKKAWPESRFMEGVDPQGTWSSGQGGVIDDKGNENPVTHMQNVYDMDVDWDYCKPGDGRDMIGEILQRRPEDGVYAFSINKTQSNELYTSAPNGKIIGGTQVLIDGMSGQYYFPKKTDGTYGKDPVKNLFSHPQDALMHAFLRARREKEDDEFELYAPQLQIERVQPDEFGIQF